MTQQEFESRVEMNVNEVEFNAINTVYREADVDKDEFCKMWVKMNLERIEAYKAEVNKRLQEEQLTWDLMQIAKAEYTQKEISQYADDVLTIKELELIKSAGIELTEKIPSSIMGGWFTAPKRMYTIVADIYRNIDKSAIPTTEG